MFGIDYPVLEHSVNTYKVEILRRLRSYSDGLTPKPLTRFPSSKVPCSTLNLIYIDPLICRE